MPCKHNPPTHSSSYLKNNCGKLKQQKVKLREREREKKKKKETRALSNEHKLASQAFFPPFSRCRIPAWNHTLLCPLHKSGILLKLYTRGMYLCAPMYIKHTHVVTGNYTKMAQKALKLFLFCFFTVNHLLPDKPDQIICFLIFYFENA